MNFLEVEIKERKENFSMPEPHFHEYYEFYFLLEGTREVFIENKMHIAEPGTLCIIPPYTMHKMEGKAYKRVNIYISKSMMRESDLAFLENYDKVFAFSLPKKQKEFISELLGEAAEIDEALSFEQRKSQLLPYVQTVFSYLQTRPLAPLTSTKTKLERKKTDPTILKVISYINENYASRITLADLSQKFFISTNTLCKRFQQAMQCSIIQYTNIVRLNKAKMFLSQSPPKNLEEISELCGFSSANYFSLIFKKQFGLSPLNWKKNK